MEETKKSIGKLSKPGKDTMREVIIYFLIHNAPKALSDCKIIRSESSVFISSVV